MQEIAKKALDCARDIKLFLGVIVQANNSPMAIIQEILYQTMGFRLTPPPKGEPQVVEKGIDNQGKRQRARIYNFTCPEDREEVFERWLRKDEESAIQENVSNYEQMAHEKPIDI